MVVSKIKKKDLLPTYDNICSTFCNDTIGRNEELLYFIGLLDTISGAYSIALDGRWGSGKTFFVKQAKMLMDVYNPFSQLIEWDSEEYSDKIKEVWNKLTQRCSKKMWEPKPYLCVYFDAWEFDMESEPISALLYQIALVASNDYKLDNKRNATDIIGNVLDILTGKKFKDLLNSLKNKQITDKVKEDYDIRQQVDKYFSSLLPEHGDRLIIFIDELDRCMPSYAVKLLERIKHYFANDKITFVFSLNMEQMQHTVRRHYGDGFDAHKYIERFFDLTVSLPKISKKKLYNYFSYDFSSPVFQIADAFAQKNNMELREITRYFSTLNMMISLNSSNISVNALMFCHWFLIPVAVGLQKINIDKYYEFIDGVDSSPLTDLIYNEKVLDIVRDFFSVKQESEAKLFLENVYRAILIDAKEKKSNTIQGHFYNENIYNFFIKSMSLLSSAIVLE